MWDADPPLVRHEDGKEDCRDEETADGEHCGPAPVGRLDDRVDQRRHRPGREHQAQSVGGRCLGIARRGDAEPDQYPGEGGNRDEGDEHAGPREVLEQPAAHDRPDGDAHPGAGAPEPDRPRALAALGEDVGQKRQGGREDQCGAEPHDGTRGDQLTRVGSEPAGEAREAKHRQTDEEHALASDAVAEVARGKHERGEHQVVGVDDPLQLRGRGPELSHDRGQGDVDDRRVEVDGERGQQQRDEDQRLVRFVRLAPSHRSTPAGALARGRPALTSARSACRPRSARCGSASSRTPCRSEASRGTRLRGARA
jgi:hypothetical protein